MSKNYSILCRTTSYRNTPQATETFSESISPKRGSFALESTKLSTDDEMPLSSDPMSMAQGCLKSVV